MSSSSDLAGLDAPAAEVAGDTLAGAVAVAAALPDGAPLLAAAQAAFTDGLRVTAVVAAAIVVAGAFLAAVLLRRVGVSGAEVAPQPSTVEAVAP